MRQSILFAELTVLVFSLASCKEENVHPEFNNARFWGEHHAQVWDSTSTANNLLGSWQWVYTTCCGESLDQTGRQTEEEDFIITFSEKNLEVTEHSKVRTSGWSIDQQHTICMT